MNSNNYGIFMACAERQVPLAAYPLHKAAAEHLSNPRSENYGALEKMGAHIAAELYVSTGQMLSPEYCIFNNLRKVASWYPALDRFVEPVFNALCNEFMGAAELTRAQDEAVKKASIGAILSNIVGKTITGGPAVAKMILAGGAAAGAGAGALYWGLNRDSMEDDDKTEAMKAKIKLYNRITREISEDMRRNNTHPTESNREIISENAGTNHIL